VVLTDLQRLTDEQMASADRLFRTLADFLKGSAGFALLLVR